MIVTVKLNMWSIPEVPKLWSAPLGGASCLFEGYIYFERNLGSGLNMYGRHFAWLKYFTYRLVPVLAPKYNLHILSLAEVRKVY
jgi:hypothetical protein